MNTHDRVEMIRELLDAGVRFDWSPLTTAGTPITDSTNLVALDPAEWVAEFFPVFPDATDFEFRTMVAWTRNQWETDEAFRAELEVAYYAHAEETESWNDHHDWDIPEEGDDEPIPF